MNIKILGTRGEIQESAPYHAKKSGVLIDNTLLLDCGEESFLAYKPQAILFTHLHPDHAFFTRHFEQPDLGSIQLYAPESYLDMKIHVTKRTFKIGDYKITPIPTIHSVRVKSNAYLIEHKGIRLLYTGDMIWIEKKYHKRLHNLDLVITEASFIREGGIIRRNKETGAIFGHTGAPNLISLFSRYTRTILLMHFGKWFYKDSKKAKKDLKSLGKEHDVEVIVGYDGLEVTI